MFLRNPSCAYLREKQNDGTSSRMVEMESWESVTAFRWGPQDQECSHRVADLPWERWRKTIVFELSGA